MAIPRVTELGIDEIQTLAKLRAPSIIVEQRGGAAVAIDAYGRIIAGPSTDHASVINAAINSAGKGVVYIRSGSYSAGTITLGTYTSMVIEDGASGITLSFPSGYSGLVVDLRERAVFFGQNGEVLKVKSWGRENTLMIKAATPNTRTVIQIFPSGAPSPWTALLQLFNTDRENDPNNYEALEITWENNVAYINVFKGGSGQLREFHLKINGNSMVKLLPQLGSTYGLILHANYKAGDPTTSELPDGWFGLFKNTSTGAVKIWYNDGGTLKSVTLA
jgi:hypothetical protein